jgi:DNA replication and repair protein RecF
LKDYKKILKSRNLALKAINEWKAKKEEIEFWNNKFIELSKKIYIYRFELVNFLKDLVINVKESLSWKIKNVSFEYVTKVDRENVENSLKIYLEKNFDRDIILQKTHIWPHIDDFVIKIDEINITQYASRWEVKSIMIYLKLLEWLFIEKKTWKKPIMIIDDLISELDLMRKNILIEKIKYYQSFISCVFEEQSYFNIIL